MSFNRDYDWKGDRRKRRYRQLSAAEIDHWSKHQKFTKEWIHWGRRRILNDPYARSINPTGHPWHPTHFPHGYMSRDEWAEFKHFQWMQNRRFHNRQGQYLPQWITQKIIRHAQHYPEYRHDYHRDWYNKWYGLNPPSWQEYRDD